MNSIRTAIITILPVWLIVAPPAVADQNGTGQQAFAAIKQCVMRNDTTYCHSLLTEDSLALFDRFSGYKLMPCLPTDFSYASEENAGDHIVVKATMPASNDKIYNLRMIFHPVGGVLKLDIPESLRLGMGQNWQNKVQLAEQIYLMMKQNLGDKLNCDMLTGLIQK